MAEIWRKKIMSITETVEFYRSRENIERARCLYTKLRPCLKR